MSEILQQLNLLRSQGKRNLASGDIASWLSVAEQIVDLQDKYQREIVGCHCDHSSSYECRLGILSNSQHEIRWMEKNGLDPENIVDHMNIPDNIGIPCRCRCHRELL